MSIISPLAARRHILSPLGAGIAPSGPQTIVSCSFTGDDGINLNTYTWPSPDVRPDAQQWQKIPGNNYLLSSNQAKIGDTKDWLAEYYLNLQTTPPLTHYLDISIPGNLSTFIYAFRAGTTQWANYWLLWCSPSTLILYDKNFANRGSSAWTWVTPTVMKIVDDGSLMKVYMNDVLKISYTSTDLNTNQCIHIGASVSSVPATLRQDSLLVMKP